MPISAGSESLPEKRRAVMLTIVEPRCVNLGGVQQIAPRIKIGFDDIFRLRIVDGGTKLSGAETEYRCGEVSAWNRAAFHSSPTLLVSSHFVANAFFKVPK